ncbi:hypothetical protein D3C81_1894840 [compost metagenome]
MSETVAALVQLEITVLLREATGGNPLRMLGNLRFEQLDVTGLQWILAFALVTTVNQELLLLDTE